MRLALLLVLAGCGGNFAPADPPPTSTTADASDDGVFEVETPTSEDARTKMAARCPNGYVVEREDFIEDGVGQNQASGRGRTALPATPRTHVRVRFRCNASEREPAR